MSRERVLISRERIAQRVAEIGLEMSRELAREAEKFRAAGQSAGPIVMVPVLTGALVFVSDLIRNMPVSMSIKPVTLSSYPGKSTSSQGVTVQSGVPTDLRGCRVVLVDDILDSGQTLGLLRRMVMAQNVQSLRTVVLLDKKKPSGRKEEVQIEFAGFEIEDEFVVGYGLDYDGLYRNVPDIVVLDSGATGGT
ncbi:MAG: phosphoribosyltransferase [Phycisphaerales bacterium]